jgi:hypothetical protein
MAKRTRGSQRRRRRPGVRPQQRPTDRRTDYHAAAGAIAYELRQYELRQEEAAEPAGVTAADAGASDRPATTHVRHKVKAGSLLAARAATEYVYVGRDMRQILFVAVGLFGALFVLWLLIVVGRVVPLSFY